VDRLTVDFGIDLGTTNSSAAVLIGTETRVFDNPENQKYTPSAVWVDAGGRLYVGHPAKQRMYDDEANTKAEFKRTMGTAEVFRFAATGREMKPEELSAEVLKSLRADVERGGEDMSAAVIGVPAAFDIAACQATERAARLAGLQFSPLLQEPVAAALAYGFQSESKDVFWMVYDLGGGTFDAAIMQVQDGAIRVEYHGGDDKLGGKEIDWAIVERLLVPALIKEHPLADFKRSNPKWRAAFARLKLRAEEAKIRLSRDPVFRIVIEPLCQDDRGLWVRFEHELRREDIEPLVEPVVERSIRICQRVLQERRLGPEDIERLILVGGPTITPLLREMVAAKLKIRLEYRVDPLTVVAQGAAIFAGTQRYEKKGAKLTAGQYTVELLGYTPIGTDPEPLVGGVVHPPSGRSLEGLTVEFVEAQSGWRSGQAALRADGGFRAQLRADKGRRCEFRIELKDATGHALEAVPGALYYTIGYSPTDQSLINSLGVALANNEALVFLKKGAPLPAKRRETLHTTIAVQRGQSGALLRIPVIEGERQRADRNRFVGALEVRGDQVPRDVPVGSDIELVLEVDASRMLKARALIPIVDQEYTWTPPLEKPAHDPADLATDMKGENTRLQKLQGQVKDAADPASQAALDQLEALAADAHDTLAGAGADRDEADKCHSRLLELRCALDDLEGRLEWPRAVGQGRERLAWAASIVEKYGDKDDKQRLAGLEAAVEAAINARDIEVLRQQTEAVTVLAVLILQERPEYWVGLISYVAEHESELTDKPLAQKLFMQARRAIAANDLAGLKTAGRQLRQLLPDDIPDVMVARQYISTVKKREF